MLGNDSTQRGAGGAVGSALEQQVSRRRVDTAAERTERRRAGGDAEEEGVEAAGVPQQKQVAVAGTRTGPVLRR